MLGQILLAYRKAKHISQQKLADRLGISRTYLSEIERGRAANLSFKLGIDILNLGNIHHQIEVSLIRRVRVDAAIAAEIVWLNSQDVITEGSCAGPPPTAVIRPSSVERARQLGYTPLYQEHSGLFEIALKSAR